MASSGHGSAHGDDGHDEGCCEDHGGGHGHDSAPGDGGHDGGCCEDHGGGHAHAGGHGHDEKAVADAEAESAAPKASDIFMMARQQNFGVALQLLTAYPEHWLAVDEDGHGLLHWAALVGSTDFVKAALEKGVPVDIEATNLQTPLMWATLRGHIQTARVLVDRGAKLQHRDSLGATSLMIAIQHRQYQMFLVLMHRGGESLLNDKDNNGCTAAHWAAYKGDIMALKLLSYFGADLQATDASQMLPLHRSVSGSQTGVIEFLVEQGSDPMQRNGEGKNCMDIADEQQDIGMQSMFKRIMQTKKTGAVRRRGAGDVEEGIELTDMSEGKDEDDKKPRNVKSRMMMLFKDKHMHKLFPAFWLICVSLTTFEYLMDMHTKAWAVAPTAALLFELGIPLSVCIFAWTALGDPGIEKAKVRGNSGVEVLMKAYDSDMPEDELPAIDRLCTSTWIIKGLRSKYCTQTQAVVQEFDHYCIWLNCTIGRNNHRQFILLAITEWCTQLVNIYICWVLSRELVPYETLGGWFYGLISTYPLLFLISVVQCLTCPWVFMLILHQFRLVAMNLTTNEMINAHRYDHFWKVEMIMPGRMQKSYRNPFSKGSVVKNCLDFWWFRNRSETVALPEASASHVHGSGCQSQGCQSQSCSRNH